MFYKRTYTCFGLLIAMALTSIFGVKKDVSATTRMVVTQGGLLKVTGSTNISNFCYSISNYNNPDTITIYRYNSKNDMLPMNGSLNFNVNSFSSDNNFMTNEFRKTLKSLQYPTLTVSFLSINKVPELKPEPENVSGWITVTVAGVTKKYLVNYTFTSINAGMIKIDGAKTLSFSDFNLEAPKKFGGMIRTKETLDIAFQLYLKIIN